MSSRWRREPTFSCLSILALVLLVGARDADARGKIPVLEQITRITAGDLEQVRLRSMTADYVVFVSDGDVLGAGTATSQREVYLHDAVSGTTMRVTDSTGCESYDATRVTDSVFAGGRPEALIVFVSTCNFDPSVGNSDGNPEIFLYDVDQAVFHQLTDTLPPVVNAQPFASDNGKCIVFQSTDNLDQNVGQGPQSPPSGFSNLDGSPEIFLYTVNSGGPGFPHDGYFHQVSDGVPGTTSSAPVVGGYWFARQCQNTAFLSDHDQLDDGSQGTHVYIFNRPSGLLERVLNLGGRTGLDVLIPPDGGYGRPHISSASPFARGPHVVFSTNADIWNNGLTGYEAFRYRLFHPRLTQYTHVPFGDVLLPQVSDGGGRLVFQSDAELIDTRHGARGVEDPGPYNADGNYEIFRTKGLRNVWQITRSENCENSAPTIKDDGTAIAFRSTCDLIPGNNPLGAPQAFLYREVKGNDPILAPGACRIEDGCCSEGNDCYTRLLGKRLKAPARNDDSLDSACIEGTGECALPVRVFKVKRLNKPAGDQVLKINTGKTQGFGLQFDPLVDGLTVSAESTTGSVLWSASIAAGGANWKQRGSNVSWRAPSTGHADGLRSLKVGLPGSAFRLKVKASDTDASAVSGAQAAVIRLSIGSAEWTGDVGCSTNGEKLICNAVP